MHPSGRSLSEVRCNFLCDVLGIAVIETPKAFETYQARRSPTLWEHILSTWIIIAHRNCDCNIISHYLFQWSVPSPRCLICNPNQRVHPCSKFKPHTHRHSTPLQTNFVNITTSGSVILSLNPSNCPHLQNF